MKKFKKFTPFLILCLFLISPSLTYPQGATSERVTVQVALTQDDGTVVTVYGDGTIVDIQNSNFLKTYMVKVPEDVMDQIDFGYFANKIIGAVLTLDTGETIIGAGFLNKAGILTITAHKNGAGTFFPKGWLRSFNLPI